MVLEGRSPSYCNLFDTKPRSPENSDFLVVFQSQEFIVQVSRGVFLPPFDVWGSASIGSTGGIGCLKSAVSKT